MTDYKSNHDQSITGYIYKKKNACEKGGKANDCHNKRELIGLTTIVIFTHNRDPFDDLSEVRI
jgi:hypothetical protein